LAFGWAIISTAFHAENKIAPAIAAAVGAELVAVCSRDQGRAERFAEKHGARAAYHSVDDMLRDSRVDAVFDVSPNYLHARHTLQAAQAGKHVLADKPLAITLEDALAMVRQCRARGVKLGLGFEMRQHPGHILARDVIAQGALGRIGLAQGLWAHGDRGQTEPEPRTGLRQWWQQPELVGGPAPMMRMGLHLVDLLRFLLRQEVSEVVAMNADQAGQQPVESLVTMCLRFGGGAIATICIGLLLPDSPNDIRLYGTDGRITGRSTLGTTLEGEIEIVSETLNQTEVYPSDPLLGFVEMLEDFRRAVEEDREPAATGVDGLRVVQVTLAMIESARTGRTIRLEPLSI